ncbi:MAG: hypothetical protein IKL04_03820 [Lachnospiraceae bacterium]|nr:hypothetical protein [Lachnospiraceae bacterium]
MLALYIIALVVAIAELIVLLKGNRKNQNSGQLFLFTATVLGNMGYLAQAVAQETETALLANRLIYTGSIFMPFCLMMTIADLCEMGFPRKLKHFLLVWSFVVLIFSYSVGYSTLYYRNVSLEKAYGISYLVKEYGPAHNLYTFLLLFEVLMCFGIIIKTMLSEKSFSRKTSWELLLALSLSTLVYGGEKVLGTEISLLPVAYCLSSFLYLHVCKRMKVYDMSAGILGTYEQMEEFAYISFDTDLRFMNCNALAKKIFPELKSMQVDRPIEDADTEVYRKVVVFLKNYIATKKDETKIEVGERHLECKAELIYGGFNEKVIGYIIEIEDITRQQKYIELLNRYNTELENEVRKKTKYMNAMQEAFGARISGRNETKEVVAEDISKEK